MLTSHRDSFLPADLARAAERGETSVLATVVRVVGSAYRGVGAHMLVRADETTTGLVSGGCLEGDLVSRARAVRQSMRSALATYDTRSGDDLVWGLGLGCEGLVEVLLEPLSPEEAMSLASLMQRANESKERTVVATVFDADVVAHVGSRVLVDMTGTTEGTYGASLDESFLERVRDDASDLLQSTTGDVRGTTRRYELTGTSRVLSVAFELLAPPIHLLTCGAGPDVIPLARLAHSLGWSVTVADHRGSSAHAERFPGVDVVAGEPAALVSGSVLGSRTHAVIMSHHFERDLAYLHALLESDVRYIGLLGPRQRTERLIAEREARFAPLTEEMRARVFGPVGLDLGGDGPDAVALAIVGEVLAIAMSRSGGHLRDRVAPIHSPQPELALPAP
jgi:xanthine dehydrogenase accessory factor